MSLSQDVIDAIEDGNFEESTKLLNQAIGTDDEETLLELGDSLYSLGFLDESKQVYENLLQHYPMMDVAKSSLADIMIAEGDYETATDLLEQIKPDSDAYGESLLVSADLYQTMGIYEVSEQKLKTGIHLYPDEPAFRFGIGELYLTTSQFQKAKIAYQWLLAHDIKTFMQVSILGRMGEVDAGTGDFEGGIAAVETIPIEIRTKDQWFTLGILYFQLKDYENSENALLALKELDPDFTSLYPTLAQAEVALNEDDEALKAVQSGLMLDEQNEDLYLIGAEIALRLKNQELAQSYYEHAISINPDNITAKLGLSNLFLIQNKPDDTIELLSDQTFEEEQDPQYYWNLGRAFLQKEEMDKARENYLLAYPQFKNNPDFLYDFISFLQEDSATDMLVLALKRYLELRPDDLQMQELLDSYTTDDY